MRRLFICLQASIYEGTQWVVFEPNDEELWSARHARKRARLTLMSHNLTKA
jgi:phage tail sheath protein FI